MNKSFLGVSAACVAAALTGYLLADRTVSVAGKNEPALSQTHSHKPGNLPGAMKSLEPTSTLVQRTPYQLAMFKETLKARYKSCASATYDWVMRSESQAMLATMSATELEDFAREMAPADAGNSHGEQVEWQWQMMTDVFRQWGEKDPTVACIGLAIAPLYRCREEAFDAWRRRDPEAAQAWVMAGKFPLGGEKDGKDLQTYFLKSQSAADLSSSREFLGKLDLDSQKQTLLGWSKQLAHDPAKRDELLAMIATRGDSELIQKCYEKLVKEMATKSPRAASDFLENSNLPEDQKYALSHQMLGEWAKKEPHQAFASWAELKEDQAPEPLLKALADWSINSPGAEESIEWVNKLDASTAKEQFKMKLIKQMRGFERNKQAADLAASLSDPQERLRQMKIVKQIWEERWPDAASAWFDKLPMADQKALGNSSK
jgi:hypothetical protein